LIFSTLMLSCEWSWINALGVLSWRFGNILECIILVQLDNLDLNLMKEVRVTLI